MRLLFVLLSFSLTATAGEVTEFKPRPAAVDEGTDTYVGILLSEEDFRKLLQEKIDISNTDEIFRIKENISRVKTLISQINIEFSLFSSDYDEKINTYKFPESLQVINQKIINNKKDLKKAKKEYNNYQEMVSKEEEDLSSGLL